MRDYRDTKTYKSSTEAARARLESEFNPFWWQATDAETRVKALVNTAKSLEQNSEERHQANLRHARMYENVELDSLSGGDYATSIIRQALLGRGVVRLNVVAACEDTLAAKITKNKPRPMFLTSGGSWDQQVKARKLNNFGRGLFYETNVFEKSKEVAVDGFTFGTGLLHVFKGDDKRLECERVLPDEIFVDDADAMYGAPRQMMRRKRIHREVLVSMFPEHADRVYGADAPANRPEASPQTPMVEVWEAWHLPSKKGAGDGMHSIAIDGCELFSEKWTLSRFPFVPFRYKKRLVGFWGKGVAETLTGIQIELNRLMHSVSEQLRRRGRGRVFIQKGSSVNPNHLTNAVGDIVTYVGAPPIVDNQNAVAAEEFMQIDRLYQRAFQEVGISELSAAAKKPSGLDAAVALREFSDIESERFALVHQAWEQFFLDFMSLSLDMIRTFGGKGYKVRLPSKRLVINIDWNEIDLDEESYVMQMFPVSSLPQTPAARYQKVKEMMQDGFIDKAAAQRLLDYPDLEAEQNLGNAALDDADATISAVLDAATPQILPVEPYQNLELLTSRATAAYLFAKHNGCSEDRLDMLRQLIDDATATIAALAAPPPGPIPGPEMGPPPGAMPPAPGMMPPAPGMMPNLGGASLGNLNVNVAAPGQPPVAPPVVA